MSYIPVSTPMIELYDAIAICEHGDQREENTMQAFQLLLNSGVLWNMPIAPEFYKDCAEDLISGNYITPTFH